MLGKHIFSYSSSYVSCRFALFLKFSFCLGWWTAWWINLELVIWQNLVRRPSFKFSILLLETSSLTLNFTSNAMMMQYICVMLRKFGMMNLARWVQNVGLLSSHVYIAMPIIRIGRYENFSKIFNEIHDFKVLIIVENFGLSLFSWRRIVLRKWKE